MIEILIFVGLVAFGWCIGASITVLVFQRMVPDYELTVEEFGTLCLFWPFWLTYMAVSAVCDKLCKKK